MIRERIIENWEAKDEPPHLRQIRDRVLHEGGQRSARLLSLYGRILEEGGVPADDSDEQTELRLSGLVVRDQNRLRVYNRIYAEIFDARWVSHALEQLRPYAEDFNAWQASGHDPHSCQSFFRIFGEWKSCLNPKRKS
ncbi:MAG: hypothetical protein B6245_12715 [Desulfobacteraceae bacterium 4572_88]|nr:MAG: hypothetical protein B6245_12715 [Desulfobacteraceae bacterium 4572_88]